MKKQSSIRKKNTKLFIALLIVVFFVFLKGVLYFNHLKTREVYFYSDEAIYAELTKRFIKGDILDAFHPYWNPGLPLATVPFYLLTGNMENSQVMVSMAAVLGTILLLFIVLQEVSIPLAIIASFLLTFSGGYDKIVLYWGTTEPLYVLFYWLAIFFGWKLIKYQEIKYSLITGLFWGLAFFTRTEAIFSLTFYIIIFILSRHFEKKKISFNKYFLIPFSLSLFVFFESKVSRVKFFAIVALVLSAFFFLFRLKRKTIINDLKKTALSIFFILLSFFLINSFYIGANSIHLGKLTISGKYGFLLVYHPFDLEPHRYSTSVQDIWSIDYPNFKSSLYDSGQVTKVMWKNMDNALDAAAKRLMTYFSWYGHDYFFTNLEVCVIIFGFIAAAFLASSTGFFIYYFLIVTFGLLAVDYTMDIASRYITFTLPLMIIGEAFGIYFAARLLRRICNSFINNKFVGKTIFLLVILGSALFLTKRNINIKSFFNAPSPTRRNADQKMIADWVKSKEIKVIMGRTEAISYYSGAKMVYLPATIPSMIVEVAKAWGVEYILARPNEASWDYMRAIAKPDYYHPDLILEHTFPDGSLVWKVRLTQEEKEHNLRTGKSIFRESVFKNQP